VKLAGKTALITGAGRGIGRGCALELARAGADCVVNDRPDSADLAATADAIRALGRRAWPVGADVFSRAGSAALVEQALAATGRIDILVSNPALNVRADFLELDPALFEQIVQGTLTSGFHMSQLVARHMVSRNAGSRPEAGTAKPPVPSGERSGEGPQYSRPPLTPTLSPEGRGSTSGGKIIFISSSHDSMPYARSVAYNAAKAGLTHMATSIAVELCRHRINVNVIEPGWIDTPAERATFGEEQLRERAPTLPWGRLGQPEDIGRAAAFLASDDADYITGAVLRVDGGFWWKDCRPEGLMAKAK
jgi:glucose 1-dehydrogenase